MSQEIDNDVIESYLNSLFSHERMLERESEVDICDRANPNTCLLYEALNILLMVIYFLIITVVIHQVFMDVFLCD